MEVTNFLYWKGVSLIFAYMVNGNSFKNTVPRETYLKSKLALALVKKFAWLVF